MSYSILIIIIIYFIGCMHLLGLEDRIVLESIFISGVVTAVLPTDLLHAIRGGSRCN